MRARLCLASAAALLSFLVGSTTLLSASTVRQVGDGTVEIAGRKLRCGGIRHVLDPRLRNLGIAVPDRRLLVINPKLLASHPSTVQLFVFHHECGHHHIGASELGADCWAVRRGVFDGWLDRTGLAHVCQSFGNARATSTHPSGPRRCQNLDRCFAAAETEKAGSGVQATALPAATPRLVVGPRLLREGTAR